LYFPRYLENTVFSTVLLCIFHGTFLKNRLGLVRVRVRVWVRIRIRVKMRIRVKVRVRVKDRVRFRVWVRV